MSGTELNDILEEYAREITRFCYSLCKNRFDADDLFQEVCLKLLKSSFKPRTRPETVAYLFRVCLNTYRTMLSRHFFAAERDPASFADEYIQNLPAAEEKDRLEYEELYAAMAKLPFKYRAVIVLSYFEGLSEAQAAKILSLPRGTVKSRLHKAKQLLKKELEKQ